MRSEAELREASGYADRPPDFGDLVRVLDHELRLIAPTDPEGSQRMKDEGGRWKVEGGRCRLDMAAPTPLQEFAESSRSLSSA